jgi:beta-galactosidase
MGQDQLGEVESAAIRLRRCGNARGRAIVLSNNRGHPMPSRRSFLVIAPALAATAGVGLAPEMLQAEGKTGLGSAKAVELRYGWQFCFAHATQPDGAMAPPENTEWQEVSVPHTWQVLGGRPDYVGVAWYRKEIHAPDEWRDQFVRVEFEAVFHTAHVLLNGKEIGRHIGKGYTAFECDLSPSLKFGEPNVLHVRVDNSLSDFMLPRMTSFDWTNDGGIIRPVRLLVSPRVFIERLEIAANPDLEKRSAEVSIRTVIRNTLSEEQSVQVRGTIERADSCGPQHQVPTEQISVPANSRGAVLARSIMIQSPALWHFDSPTLYEAEIEISSPDAHHRLSAKFGIRRFETRGSSFFLNGERVALMGVERMAGSHPEFGMAEPAEWIEVNHRDMKELNCVFTRVHWPQDKRVLDFCDRHGILMQEEIPAWGPFTFADISEELEQKLEANGREQLGEMIARDRNHPCIVSWGLCNEVDGRNPRSQRFATAMAKAARESDSSRLITYASNSLGEHPEKDMAGAFDFISTNEYFGSWAPGGPEQVRQHIEGIRRAFPGKAIVVSEYGWCECQPSIAAGDAGRVNIVNGHTDVFREFPEVAGAIYFDYNDYRTIVGDKGAGALKQRVHGVVDLYANRKPSFEALRKQASPIEKLTLEAAGGEFQLAIVTRKTLPAYTLRGYSIRWLFYGYDGLPMDGRLDKLQPLTPGSSTTLKASASIAQMSSVVADILSPTGFSIAEVRVKV